MKPVYIISFILIAIIILLLIKKNENFTSNEAVVNIAKIYADASGTATFNNLKSTNLNTNKISTNNLDISGTIKNTGNLNISGNLNIANKLDISNNLNVNTILNMVGVDIRTYLIGCTLVNQSLSTKANSGSLLHLPIGIYDLATYDATFNDITDVAIIYPGFGAQLFTNTFENNYVLIENYGTKPVRYSLTKDNFTTDTTDSIKVASYDNIKATNEIYNIDSNTIKKVKNGTVNENGISSVSVYILDINKWVNHNPN